jgi:probable rRNA maturation factor
MSASRSLHVDILCEAKAWESVTGLDALVTEAARRAFASAEGVTSTACEVTVLLADDAELQRLNRQFRSLDKPTNVLSFPAAPSPPGRRLPAAFPLPITCATL